MPAKTLSKNKDFVSIPRQLYEEFLVWEKINSAKTFIPTAAEKRMLKRARKDFAEGKYTSWEKVKHELDANRKR
ncbi:MAG: hypothetical protein AAB725_02545 [Patescibacteria group bacterium]